MNKITNILLATLVLTAITTGCVTANSKKVMPVVVGTVERHLDGKYGYLEMKTSWKWENVPLPRFAMWVAGNGGVGDWGYIRLTNTNETEYLEQKLGVKSVSSGNFMDEKYDSSTLPFYSWYDGFIFNDKEIHKHGIHVDEVHENGPTPAEFLFVVQLDKWWYKK